MWLIYIYICRWWLPSKARSWKICRRKMIQIKYVSERMITKTIKWDPREKRTDQYFFHSGYADMHTEKMYKNIETHRNNKKHTRVIAGDFNAQLGPVIDSERDQL